VYEYVAIVDFLTYCCLSSNQSLEISVNVMGAGIVIIVVAVILDIFNAR
jgi:hypothetical protein